MNGDKPKRAQVLRGLAILQGGIAFAALSLLLTLVPDGPDSKTSKSLLVWGGVAVFLIVFIEGGLSATRQAVAIRSSKVSYERGLIASIFQSVDLAGSVLLILVTLLLFAIPVTYALRHFSRQGPTISPPFVVQAGAYLAYLLVRMPLRSALNRGGNSIGKTLLTFPTYKLTADAVMIDLNIKTLGKPGKRSVVTIGFQEIDDMRVLTFAEARALLKQIGPDPPQMRMSKELLQYLQGKITRPAVYGLDGPSIGGSTLFLKGPSVLYMLTFRGTDLHDLTDAYQSFKSRPGQTRA